MSSAPLTADAKTGDRTKTAGPSQTAFNVLIQPHFIQISRQRLPLWLVVPEPRTGAPRGEFLRPCGALHLNSHGACYARTPIGQAVIAGVNKGIYELVKNIGAEAASGSVVRADGNQLYVNLGQGVVAAGDELRIISKGEELIDPETGISLGSLDTEIGSARVVNVQEQFSIAELVSSTGTPSRGDLVVSTAPPPGIEFAEGWNPP